MSRSKSTGFSGGFEGACHAYTAGRHNTTTAASNHRQMMGRIKITPLPIESGNRDTILRRLPVWNTVYTDVSKLNRNVPFLNSLEMSPFFVLLLASFSFSVRKRFFLKNFAPGCSRSDDSYLPRPIASP